MLAELAAANAAYAVIKETLANGGDLISVGGKLAEYVGLKQKIAAKSKENGGICDEFWALEKLRQQEEELKTLLIYQGRPGLWDDWLRFQENKRKEEAEQARQEKEVRRQARDSKDCWAIAFDCFALFFTCGRYCSGNTGSEANVKVHLLLLLLVLAVAGCEDRYRYPCQNPAKKTYQSVRRMHARRLEPAMT